jgi:hypothetical protein
MTLDIRLHAEWAGFEGVIGSEAAGQQTKPEFEMSEGVSAQRIKEVLALCFIQECPVVLVECSCLGNLNGVSKQTFSVLRKLGEMGREVMLTASTMVTKENQGGTPGQRVAPQFVQAARQAEEGFVFEPGHKESGLPILHTTPV